MQEALALCPLQ